jgi:hypothetical protein
MRGNKKNMVFNVFLIVLEWKIKINKKTVLGFCFLVSLLNHNWLANYMKLDKLVKRFKWSVIRFGKFMGKSNYNMNQPFKVQTLAQMEARI